MHIPLQKGDFYYNENGLMVFTEQYHLKRGNCCGNACKHCPYDHIAVPDENKRRNTGRLNRASTNKTHKEDNPD